jgi:23S rRNA-/tRNA-specific pseudouridylate synthase
MTEARGSQAAATPRILHRDSDLLVIDKPPGLATTSTDGGPCLARWAAQQDPRAPRLHASSRLDAEVTGVVTFARTTRAIEQLLAAREAGQYERFYLGLASAPTRPAEGEWTWAIDHAPKDPRRRVAVLPPAERGLAAVSRYRVLQELPTAALVLLMPQTGRTHQLRVHAAAAGSPLVGDRHYGGPMTRVLPDGRVLRASRAMLHCARVSLPDVASPGHEPLVIDAPVPADFCSLWRALGGDEAALSPQAWAAQHS